MTTARPFRGVALSLLLLGMAVAAACVGEPAPVPLDRKRDACAYCRMIVSDAHMAIQIAAPLQEPRVFDDFGCFANYLRTASIPGNGVVYVTDHRTGEWVRAGRAVYSRVDTFSAPMGSHVMAHASESSRVADPSAAPGTVIDVSEVMPVPRGKQP
jgi:copper chaperone NosL